MSNRVEELESQVAKLQAAVDGLTEELVETRERLRQLESEEGVEHTRTPERREVADDSAPTADESGASDADESGADASEETDADAATDTEDDGSDSDGNDIIVA